MRLKKPAIAVSAVALLAVAACGGGGDSGAGGPNDTGTFVTGGNAGANQDPNRQAPAPEIEGAQTGGTVKVISYAGLNTMDPTEAYYVNTSSILSGLVTRSLTQYVWDDQAQDMVLIPDLATDLGTHNDNFTEWTFTLRDGIKYENGQPVTPEDIKYGIERSFDRTTFPEGAAYSNQYFLNGDKYKGPYTSSGSCGCVEINGNDITIKMAKPFPDMPYWAAFPAMGPIPPGKASDPARYKLHPWSTGPYMFKPGGYVPEQSLELVKNPNWDPNTDPGRHQYVDGYDMEFDVPTAKVDQTLLSDNGDAKNTLSYDNIAVQDYVQFKQQAQDRLVIGSAPCTAYWAPDYRKITDIKVRQALAWAYPYADVYAATGLIPNITRIYGTNLMPPGVPGRVEYNPLPGHELGQTDPAKAKQLLQEAGKVGYEIRFLYMTDDPLSVDGKDATVAGLEKAGFKATPVATTVAKYSTVRADPNADINVRSAGWCSDWPSGSSWIPPVLQSTNLKEEGLGSNYGAFSEKSVDEQIKKIQTMPIEDQPKAWNDLDEMAMTKYFPLFVTGYYGAAMMRGSNINGFEDDTVFSMPTWKDIWLTQ
jgi:peptide/nickel transport system substrate-binding protein